MDDREDKKKARAKGHRGEERETGACIILKKGEVLSMDVYEEDLEIREKQEKQKLRDLFREIKGG